MVTTGKIDIQSIGDNGCTDTVIIDPRRFIVYRIVLEEKQAKDLLDILIKKKAVQAYPVLIEINEKRVAQAEHTFIPNEEGVTVTTRIQ